jgi:hypothetical protein
MMSSSTKTIWLTAALIILSLMLTGCLPETPPPPCTTDFLIWSINNANGNGPGTDTINLEAGCVYQLGVVDNTVDGNNGTPSITTSIIINGNGATVRRSTGSQKAAIRLFHVSQGGELVLNDIRLYDAVGMNPPDVTPEILNSGGAILNRGTLTVNNSDFDYNRAEQKGGGIYNLGTMTINNTIFQNNGVNIGNKPGESGGAIFNTGTGDATITNSTFVGNIASQSGGGIANAGMMTITNCTISANSTTLSGIASGAAIMNSGSVQISYTTITANAGTTSGAVWSAPDTIGISNSIIAGNLPTNCSYPAVSWITGPNLDDDGSCDLFTINADPQLDPLASNGGPTQTHAIAPSSPAKNAAAGSCPASDQRGESRPHGSACDLGSYELAGNQGGSSDPAELSGMVYNDINGDGVYTPGEPAFAGVELVLGVGTCSTATPTQTTIAASDGSYQFNIPSPNAGTYCISIDPLVEPNTSIIIPGGFTEPVGDVYEITLTEGQDMSDLFFGWQFQFDNLQNPLMEITTVYLNSTTIPVNTFREVEVTVTNVGNGTASGFELVLIPQYGDGPPNPAGYELLPEMAPGASHTVLFSPGVMYSTVGSYTLRTMVTDSWYTLGDPDHVGLYGDYEDTPINVVTYFCNPFKDMEVSIMMLSLPPDTRILPVYLRVEEEFFPGFEPDNDLPKEFIAQLGKEEAITQVSQQGFPNRAYWMFYIPEGLEGTDQSFTVWWSDCPEPIYELPAIQIPVPKPITPTCSADLNEKNCEAVGGTFLKINDKTSTCMCP